MVAPSMLEICMTTIPFPATTAETVVSLRRIALFAGGIAAMIAAVTAVIASRFALFGVGHDSVPWVERLREVVGL